MSDISDRLLNDIVDAVKEIVRKEQSDRLRDVYLIGDIDKDSARGVIERLRELANDSRSRSRSTSTAPAATSRTASRSTTRLPTSSLPASESPSSSREWRTRWARSCCRPRAQAVDGRSRTRGS